MYKFPKCFTDWNNPRVANYDWRAIDRNGEVHYYKYKPSINEILGVWDYSNYFLFDKENAVNLLVNSERYELMICVGRASIDWAAQNWRDSLEKRP
jgi:hypothetical protein